MALAVSYIESRGQKLWTDQDVNIVGAKVTSETYTIDDASFAAASSYITNVFSTNSARNVGAHRPGLCPDAPRLRRYAAIRNHQLLEHPAAHGSQPGRVSSGRARGSL